VEPGRWIGFDAGAFVPEVCGTTQCTKRLHLRWCGFARFHFVQLDSALPSRTVVDFTLAGVVFCFLNPEWDEFGSNFGTTSVFPFCSTTSPSVAMPIRCNLPFQWRRRLSYQETPLHELEKGNKEPAELVNLPEWKHKIVQTMQSDRLFENPRSRP